MNKKQIKKIVKDFINFEDNIKVWKDEDLEKDFPNFMQDLKESEYILKGFLDWYENKKKNFVIINKITFIEVWLFILTILIIVLYGCVLYGNL